MQQNAAKNQIRQISMIKKTVEKGLTTPSCRMRAYFGFIEAGSADKRKHR